MEAITTKEAADLCGINVQKFHREAAALGLEPEMKLPGRTGAKLWNRADVRSVIAHLSKVAS